MNATVVLDIDLPESGPAEIEIKRSFTIGVSAHQAQKAVNRWLRDEVSMSFIAESPTLALGPRIVWQVPIAYTASHVGRVGLAGTIEVDVTTAALLNTASTRAALLATARPMASALPPFQVREVDEKYLVKDLEPTHDAPPSVPALTEADTPD